MILNRLADVAQPVANLRRFNTLPHAFFSDGQETICFGRNRSHRKRHTRITTKLSQPQANVNPDNIPFA